uniref:Uncharacterized protein n=1 Tax=Amphimedon queenslandica TaxID=400682 RepID=A0A1X7TGD7_AMPQE
MENVRLEDQQVHQPSLDPQLAVKAFRKQFGTLSKLLSVSSNRLAVAPELFSEGLITFDCYKNATEGSSKTEEEKSTGLMISLMSTISTQPELLTELINLKQSTSPGSSHQEEKRKERKQADSPKGPEGSSGSRNGSNKHPAPPPDSEDDKSDDEGGLVVDEDPSSPSTTLAAAMVKALAQQQSNSDLRPSSKRPSTPSSTKSDKPSSVPPNRPNSVGPITVNGPGPSNASSPSGVPPRQQHVPLNQRADSKAFFSMADIHVRESLSQEDAEMFRSVVNGCVQRYSKRWTAKKVLDVLHDDNEI